MIGFLRKYVIIFVEEFHLLPLLLELVETIEQQLSSNNGLKSDFLRAWCFSYDYLNGADFVSFINSQDVANRRVFAFQKKLFQFTKEAKESDCKEAVSAYCTLSCADALEEVNLNKVLLAISLHDFCKWLGIRCSDVSGGLIPRDQLQKSLVLHFSSYLSILPKQRPFFSGSLPTERDLFSVEAVEEIFQGDILRAPKIKENSADKLPLSLCCPKIGVQFLDFNDFLLRNRRCLEFSACIDIKSDVVNAVERLRPFLTSNESTSFAGWSKHCTEMESFEISSIQKASVLEQSDSEAFSRVTCEVSIDLSKYSTLIQKDWCNLRENDVLFLLTVAASDKNFKSSKAEVVHLRGAILRQIKDSEGKIIPFVGSFQSDPAESRPILKSITLELDLDPVQYAEDLAENAEYLAFNLILKRNPKENNFKPAIDWIGEALNSGAKNSFDFPSWFKAGFLGFGDPASSTARFPEKCFLTDFFVDSAHARSILPEWEIPENITPTVSLNFLTKIIENSGASSAGVVLHNSFPYSASQFQAIVKGLSNGLNVVVGPPGTGKTDAAVQIALNLYCTHPTEKILLLTHSNEALNVLLRKISAKESIISPSHVMRLGHGAEDIFFDADSEEGFFPHHEDFSKYGRLTAWLAHKEELLTEVDALAKSLGYIGDFGYTAETACYFYDFYIKPIVECFATNNDGAATSPFDLFFAENPTVCDSSMPCETPQQKLAYVSHIFEQLRECRPLEVLSSNADRANFVFSHKSRIIAMTTTFLAIKQQEIRNLGVQFDTVIIQEAGQILEIDCSLAFFVAGSALKRATILGDHFQLPPIVKSDALQKQSHFDQSLFVRLLRLNYQSTMFSTQARCRPEIARLFAWKYDGLQTFAHEFHRFANPGMHHVCQFVDVLALNGVGESEPTPAYFQNVAEAEFIVAVYQYLRIVGYPIDSIAILTPYNGQKALIREILVKRCATRSDVFGDGRAVVVSTVDKFQGRQAPIVLLSLVRTNSSVGHVADVRRFVVAVSRASLGLYIFGRASLFLSAANAPTIAKVFAENLPEHAERALVIRYPAEYAQKRLLEEEATAANGELIRINDAIQMSAFVRDILTQSSVENMMH